MILTIIIFVVILGILVFVHEAGHFFMAKRAGMNVEEFGFGFPPRLFGVRGKDGTVYSINAIPLGGFVRITGENNEGEDNPKSFINKPFWPRFAVLVAGVLMNLILAWVLFSVGYMHGLPVAVDDLHSVPPRADFTQQQPLILEVKPGSKAEQAGLQGSDVILSIDGHQLTSINDVQGYVTSHKGQNLNFEIQRVAEHKQITVDNSAGQIGVGLATLGNLSFPWYIALWEGGKTTLSQLSAIVSGLYHLIVSGQGLKSLGGPVKIAQITGQVAKLGFIHLLQFTAFLSLNLAILNILPFPALDGGRVLFLIIEKIRGKRNNQRVEQIANTAGFALLLLLMLVVTVKDIFLK